MVQFYRKNLYFAVGTVSLLLTAYILPAQARPRDDAMAGVYRCSAIGPRACGWIAIMGRLNRRGWLCI
jgi:hypothetical protein